MAKLFEELDLAGANLGEPSEIDDRGLQAAFSKDRSNANKEDRRRRISARTDDRKGS